MKQRTEKAVVTKNLNDNNHPVGKKTEYLATKLLELSQSDYKVGIFPHARADGDAIGSALALSNALTAIGLNSSVYTDEEIDRTLAFMPMTDELIIYNEEFENMIPDLAIAVDLNSFDRLEKRESFFLNVPQYMIIDHHTREDEQMNDFELIDTSASSTSELIFRIISSLEELSGHKLFNADIACLLMVGIMTDTGRFSYDNTTPLCLRQAAYLLEDFKPDLKMITHEIFERTTVRQIKIKADVLSSAKLTANGRIFYAAVPYKMLVHRNAKYDDLNFLSSAMREADGVDLAILLRETEDASEIQGSVRSNDCLDAAVFSRLFGGGGHKRAAGFTINGMSLAEAEEIVIAKATELLNQCQNK